MGQRVYSGEAISYFVPAVSGRRKNCHFNILIFIKKFSIFRTDVFLTAIPDSGIVSTEETRPRQRKSA